MGTALLGLGDLKSASTALEAGLAISLEIGDRYHEMLCLTPLTNLDCLCGQLEHAATRLQRALALSRELEEPFFEGEIVNNL